jgi:hypothetical protein
LLLYCHSLLLLLLLLLLLPLLFLLLVLALIPLAAFIATPAAVDMVEETPYIKILTY